MMKVKGNICIFFIGSFFGLKILFVEFFGLVIIFYRFFILAPLHFALALPLDQIGLHGLRMQPERIFFPERNTRDQKLCSLEFNPNSPTRWKLPGPGFNQTADA